MQRDNFKVYRDDTQEEIIEDFMEALQAGSLSIPNSISGDYRHSFLRFGFKSVDVVDWSSSAGDWCFGVEDDQGVWHQAFQETRYPYHGYRYSVDLSEGYQSFAEMVEFSRE